LEHRSEANGVVRALIEKQRGLANSDDSSMRFRTLWVAAMLDKRLSHCTDRQIADLMNCIQDRLDIFGPEMAICHHARRRLLRSAGLGVQNESTNREVGGE
jgi:hypothetical protein